MKKAFVLGVLASVGSVSICFGMQRDVGVQQVLEDKSETVVVQLNDQKAEEAFNRNFVEERGALLEEAIARLGGGDLGDFADC
jgi:hypothetical protein